MHRPSGGGGQHHPGSDFHFWPWHGSPGGCPGDDYLPVFFRCLDCAFPDRKKNHTAPPAVLPASAVEENPGHCGTGNERFYHGNHQLYRADRVQCDASDIRRGSLCGRYDSHQLPAGGGVHAGAGRHKQRPAGYGL